MAEPKLVTHVRIGQAFELTLDPNRYREAATQLAHFDTDRNGTFTESDIGGNEIVAAVVVAHVVAPKDPALATKVRLLVEATNAGAAILPTMHWVHEIFKDIEEPWLWGGMCLMTDDTWSELDVEAFRRSYATYVNARSALDNSVSHLRGYQVFAPALEKLTAAHEDIDAVRAVCGEISNHAWNSSGLTFALRPDFPRP